MPTKKPRAKAKAKVKKKVKAKKRKAKAKPKLKKTSNVLQEYMQFLKDTSWYIHAGELSDKEFSYLAMGLAGETGEFVDEFKKGIRLGGFDQPYLHSAYKIRREKLTDELGDVFWYLTNLCRLLGTSPVELMLLNTLKLYDRMKAEGKYKRTLKWPFTDHRATRPVAIKIAARRERQSKNFIRAGTEERGDIK